MDDLDSQAKMGKRAPNRETKGRSTSESRPVAFVYAFRGYGAESNTLSGIANRGLAGLGFAELVPEMGFEEDSERRAGAHRGGLTACRQKCKWGWGGARCGYVSAG